jgi:flavodoxin
LLKTLIVYDSVFGNTAKIAQAIGQAVSDTLGALGDVQTLQISQVTAESLPGLDVLILGSPTRGFRPTEAVTKLLNSLPKNYLAGIRVVAFDTRIELETIDSGFARFIVDKGGYAASTIAKTLEKKGGTRLAPPEGFLVTGEQGPLKDGELERAAAWAKSLF